MEKHALPYPWKDMSAAGKTKLPFSSRNSIAFAFDFIQNSKRPQSVIIVPCLWILQYVCMQKQAIMPVWLPLLYLYIFLLLVVSLFYGTHNKQYQCVDLVDYAVLLLWSWEAEYMRLSFDIQILFFALGPFSPWGRFCPVAVVILWPFS